MEYKTLYNKEKIPVLGIGTWGMGGGMMKSTANDAENIAALKTAIKLGITHIDTAEMYGSGHSEELVGEAIKGVARKKLFITTKVWSTHLSYEGVINACKNSLKRLGLNYVDLYLIHWPNPLFSFEKTMKAMDYLVDNKMTRYIGVSNFSVSQMEKAQKSAKHKIVTNQVEYHLLNRRAGHELLPYCVKNNIILTAYSPLARGKLAQWGYNEALDAIAKKYKKTPAQVALRWLIQQPNTIVIPKASRIEHVKELVGAVGWELLEGYNNKLSIDFS